MSPNLLTDDEVIDLTGYKLPSKQAEVLARHHINYVTRKDGHLSVTWFNVNNPGTTAAANDESGFNAEFMDHG